MTRSSLSSAVVCFIGILLTTTVTQAANDTLFTLTPSSRIAEQKRAISSVLSVTGDTLYTMYVDLVGVRNPPDILVRSWDMVKGNVISDVTVPVWQPSDIGRSLNQIICIKGTWVLFSTRDPGTICCYSLPTGRLLSTCVFPKGKYFDDLFIREIDTASGYFIFRFSTGGGYEHKFDILNNTELGGARYIEIASLLKGGMASSFTNRSTFYSFASASTADSCTVYEYDYSKGVVVDSLRVFYPLVYDRSEDLFFQQKSSSGTYTVREYNPRTKAGVTRVCHFNDSISNAFIFVPKRKAVLAVDMRSGVICKDLLADTVLFSLRDTTLQEVKLSPDKEILVLKKSNGFMAIALRDFSTIMNVTCTWASSASVLFISKQCILCDRAETLTGMDIFDLQSATVRPWHIEPVALSVSGDGKQIVVYDDSSRAYRRYELVTGKASGSALGSGITMQIVGAVQLQQTTSLLLYGAEEAKGTTFRLYNAKSGLTALRTNVNTKGIPVLYNRGTNAPIFLDPKSSPAVINVLSSSSLDTLGSLSGELRILHYAHDATCVLLVKERKELVVIDATTLLPLASKSFDTSVVSGVVLLNDSVVIFNTYDYRVGKWWIYRDSVVWLRDRFNTTDIMQAVSPAGKYVITSRALVDVNTGDESSIPESDFQSMSDYVGLYNNDSLFFRQSIDGVMRASTTTSKYEEKTLDFNKTSAFFHPTLPLQVVAGINGRTELYNIRDSAVLLTSAPIPFAPHVGQGKQFSWSDDGSTMSFISTTGTLYVWRPKLSGATSVRNEPQTREDECFAAPNPANDYVTVSFPLGTMGQLVVSDILGKHVFSKEVVIDGPFVISTHEWRSGLYVCHLSGLRCCFVVTR